MLYLKYFAITGILPLLFFLFLGFYLQPLSGDLTRVGSFAERDFGWNAVQPTLKVNENQETLKPSVVVLGDSFSKWNIWQSAATENSGLNFLTFSLDEFGNPNCLESWILSLKDVYASVQVIIVETSERRFLSVFNSPQNFCQNWNKKPIKLEAVKVDRLPAQEKINIRPARVKINIREALPDPVYAIRAALNTLKTFDAATMSGDVIVAPLNRTDLFSNNRSDLILYYKADNSKRDWKSDDIRKAVSKIRRIQDLARSRGITLIILAIPDKSTVYSKFFTAPQFLAQPPDVWKELDEQGVNQVDLKRELLSAVDSNQDLYLPNDSHLGIKGYILMGNAVANNLKQNKLLSCELTLLQ